MAVKQPSNNRQMTLRYEEELKETRTSAKKELESTTTNLKSLLQSTRNQDERVISEVAGQMHNKINNVRMYEGGWADAFSLDRT